MDIEYFFLQSYNAVAMVTMTVSGL